MSKLKEELNKEQHNDLLKNKQADRLSAYVAYQNAADIFGVEKALEMLGLDKPPREPF